MAIPKDFKKKKKPFEVEELKQSRAIPKPEPEVKTPDEKRQEAMADVGQVPTKPEQPSSALYEKDGAKFLLPVREIEALKAQKGTSNESLNRYGIQQQERESQMKAFIELQQKRQRGEVLNQNELELLKGLSSIPELKEQILNPSVNFKDFYRTVSNLSSDDLSEEDARQLYTSMFSPYDVETASNDLKGSMRQFVNNAFQKGGKAFIGIDTDLKNIEASLINHKEGSADVLRAVQSGSYDAFDGMEDLNQMVEDINEAEATIQILSIYSPGTYGEKKGWEYQTRIKKIRRAVLARQGEVINLAATGVTGTTVIGGEAAGTPPSEPQGFLSSIGL